ncbi:MAG: diacylglycerol kinase family lipid kinase [Anaerolineales bacterium]|nr:diacylglycerol kinase family lipid kinase [Anaerolineales bacterium]
MKAHLVYNPAAGPRDMHRALRHVVDSIERHGWSVELKLTEKPGDATSLSEQAADAGLDVVIVAGGDGTLNEAVNGLVGSDTALAVLPVGTGNMWAKQMGIPTYTLANPLRLHEAAEGLVQGVVRSIDVGKVNGRHFLCWAGIGLDAQVTTEMEPRPRHTKRLGALAYVVATILVARDFRGFRARAWLDGSVVRGRTLLVLVSNIPRYAGVPVGQDTRIDDGLLDAFVFKGLGFPYAVAHVLKILSRRHLQDPRVVHRQVRHVEVQTEWATPVQVDGNPIGTTPVVLDVVPGGLRVLVPPSASPSLFSP